MPEIQATCGDIEEKENGWWELNTTVDLSDVDLEYIAQQIKEGFTSGQIISDDSDTGDEK